MIGWPVCVIAEQIIGLGQPDDPSVCTPTITYQSPFKDYKRPGPIKLQSWPKANQSVLNQPMHHGHEEQHSTHLRKGSQ